MLNLARLLSVLLREARQEGLRQFGAAVDLWYRV